MYIKHPADRSCWRWVDGRAEDAAMLPIRAEAELRANEVTSIPWLGMVPASDGTMIGAPAESYERWKRNRR
jgi:hypothetical protein